MQYTQRTLSNKFGICWFVFLLSMFWSSHFYYTQKYIEDIRNNEHSFFVVASDWRLQEKTASTTVTTISTNTKDITLDGLWFALGPSIFVTTLAYLLMDRK